MKYFKIKESIDSKVIGRKYPQITEVIGGYWNVLDPNSAYGQLAVGKNPTAPPPIDKLVLTKGAKRSDVLSASMISHGLVLSLNAKRVFEQYELGKFWFFPVNIVHKEDILKYYILHTNNDFTDFIDWNKTEFSLSIWSMEKQKEEIIEIVRFYDKNEYYELRDDKKKRKNMYLKIYQLVLSSDFDNNKDILAFHRIAIGKTISERLKIALEDNNISGIEFEEHKIFEKWLRK